MSFCLQTVNFDTKLYKNLNFYFIFKTEISRFVCHAEGSNIEDALKSKNYDVLSFDGHTNRFFARHCSWKISKPDFGSHLSLDSAVLDENDTLTITGSYETNYEMDYRKKNRGSTTLFRTTGNFSQKGFVYLAGYDSIYVSLWFEKNALSKDDIRKNDPRTLSIVYYESVVELSENTGQLTFFRNADQKPITNGKIVLRPVKGLRDDKLVMLNFKQISYGIPGLNSNPRVTVDGVQLNTSALPAVFLQSPLSDNITVIVNMLETEPITIHYLLVNRHCNESAVLRVEDQARPNASFQTPKIMAPPAQG